MKPVSASNLAASLGAEASGSIGDQPICVDNLAAVLEKMNTVDEVVLFLSRTGAESGTLNDDISRYSQVMYLRYTPFSGEMYLSTYMDVTGSSASDGLLSINGRSFRINRLNYTVTLIIGKK